MNYPKKKLSMISVVFAFAALMFFTCLKTDVFAANPKVTNLKQIGATDTSIDISWNAPLGAEHFTVYISEYRNLSKIIATYLKLDFQTEVLRQLSNPTPVIHPVAFISDEYSEYVSATDANFFSQSRESKCINIVQDYRVDTY